MLFSNINNIINKYNLIHKLIFNRLMMTSINLKISDKDKYLFDLNGKNILFFIYFYFLIYKI